MSRRKCLLGLVAVSATSLLAACAPTAPAAPTAPTAAAAPPTAVPAAQAVASRVPLSPRVSVRYGTIGLAPEAAVYIAYERGYFRDEGLDVEFVRFNSGAEQTAPLATGDLHFGAGGPDPSIFNANARNVSVKLVSHNSIVTPEDKSAAFIVRKDLLDSGKVANPRDLQGLTVAVNIERTTSQLYVEKVLAAGGLTISDVKLTVVPFTDMMAALSNKAVDAAWEVEPFVTLSRAQGVAQSLTDMGQVFPGAVTMVLMLSPVFAQQQEAANRFVLAHLRGLRDYYFGFLKGQADREAIAQILTQHTQIKDPQAILRMGSHGVDPNGELNLQALGAMQDYFLKVGSAAQPVDVNTIVDTSYVQRAVAQLGRVSATHGGAHNA